MAMPRCDGPTSVTSTPPISSVPSLTSSSPEMQRSKVDFPQPEGPTKVDGRRLPPRNTRYRAPATAYSGRTSTGWIAPASPGAPRSPAGPRDARSARAGSFFICLDNSLILSRVARPRAHVRKAELLENLADIAGVVVDAEPLGDDPLEIDP